MTPLYTLTKKINGKLKTLYSTCIKQNYAISTGCCVYLVPVTFFKEGVIGIFRK